jgi:uncharacterized delta-60 repeat protein
MKAMTPYVKKPIVIALILMVGALLVINVVRVNAAGGDLDTFFNYGRTAGTRGVPAASLQADGKLLFGEDVAHDKGEGNASVSIAQPLPSPGALSFSSADYSVDETSGNATITVKRTGGTDNRVVAKVTLTDVTTSAADYVFTPGALDASFDPGTGADNSVLTTALQADGKVIIGGTFTHYGVTAINRIARLNADGSLDATFSVGTGVDKDVEAIALQADGKVIIGGQFTSYNGTGRNRIARLNSDGTLDSTFNPGTGVEFAGTSTNIFVDGIALQPDGKIIIGGLFATYNGTARKFIARVNSDGSLDNTFDPGSSTDNTVFTTTLQPDGKVIIGGVFTHYNGSSRGGIARVNADGSLDTTFNPGSSPGGFVFAIAVQTDGKIIIGGFFNSYNNTTRNGIVRVNSNGSLDTSFNPAGGSGFTARTIALQPDGNIVIGGSFTAYSNTGRNRILRVNSDGSLDNTFDPGSGADNTVRTAAVQPDGNIVIGGDFSTYDGTARNHIARVKGDFFVTWAAGDSADKTISLPIVIDGINEPDETLNLSLSVMSGGASLGSQRTATLTNQDPNDPPINTVPAAQITDEDTTLFFSTANGNQFSIRDADAGTNPVRVTLTAINGTVTLSGTNGLTFAAGGGTGDGTDDAVMSFTGTITNINTALSGMSFKPAANYNGAASLQIVTNDQGKTGTGGVKSDTDTVSITVHSIADTPSVTNATTNINKQTTSGLVITRNAVDGNEVQFFKITNIQNGKLYKNDGATQISNGQFITVAEGNAGLKFTPNLSVASPVTAFSFDVQAANDSSGDGLSPAATATITINCSATSVVTNTNDSGAGSLRDATINACSGNNITFNIPQSDPGYNSQTDVYTITLTTDELLINRDLTITGFGADKLKVVRNAAGGTPNFRIFDITNGTVNLSGMTISNGKASSGGGILAAAPLSVTGCTISNNSASNGGAINVSSTMSIWDSTITKNSADSGGGINLDAGLVNVTGSIVSNNSAGSGGGIINLNGTVNVAGSTVSGNSAANGGGILNLYTKTVNVTGSTINNNSATNSGGGISNNFTGTLNVTGSTVSGNHTDGTGGGINNGAGGGGGTVSVTSSTISNNSADIGGGIFNNGTSTFRLKSSILAGNISPGSNPDLFGFATFTSQGHNLVGVSSSGAGFTNGVNGDIVGNTSSPADPNLLPLGNYGGPTQTLLPRPSSPVIDAGDDSVLNLPLNLLTDQRGSARLLNSHVDIGSVEVANYSISSTSGTPQSATINSAFTTQLQATVKESNRAVSNIPVTFTAPATGASGNFPGNTQAATVTTDANGVATAPVLTANGTTGSYNVVANLSGGSPAATFNLTSTKAQAQVILGNLAQTFDGTSKTVMVTTVPNGLPVVVTYDGSTTAPTNVKQGGYAVQVTVNDANYDGQATATLTINKASQTITFGALSAKSFGDADFTVNATVNSHLNVSFSASGNCAVSGNTIHIAAAGSCTITASQTGDGNYSAAVPVDRSLIINKAQATITLGGLNQTFDGTARNATATTVPAGLSGVTLSYSQNGAPLTLPTNAGSYTVTASLNNTNYQATDATGTLVIAKANQTITFDTLTNRTFGDAPFALSATTASGLSTSFQIVSGPASISGNNVTMTGVGHVIVRASQAGDGNYNAAPTVDRSFDVTTASATIALGNLTQTYDGTVKAPTVVTTPSGLSYTLTYSQNGQVVTAPANVGNYNVTAIITDPNYQDSTTGILVINKATPVIRWNNPASIVYGTPLGSTQLNATANTPGTFTYNPPAGTVLNVGPHQLSVTFTPTDTNNYTTAQASVTLTVDPVTAAAFNFDNAAYTVNEGDGHITLTVNRTGDTAGAASVNYTTSDTAGLTNCDVLNGIASSRCDYPTTVGILRFAVGETSRTITIPITDDAYAEGNESFSITLSNPVGEGLGTVSTATITIMDNETVTGPNPLSSNNFFIRQQYIDFLGREPEPTGLADWLSILNNCASGDTRCDRIEGSAGFFRSAEFQERGYFTYRFYSASLGRKPDYAEFMPDLAKISGFLTDAEKEANKAAFVTEFMQRAEFKNRYDSQTTATGYVDALLNTAGLPDHPSRAGWIAGLTNGTLSRAQVLRALAESAEVYRKFYNQAFVVEEYFGYLRRDPDAMYQQWIDQLDQTGDYRALIDNFLSSPEYRMRFGP